MPPVVVPLTVRAGLIWSIGGQEYAANVLHYIVPPGESIDSGEAAAFSANVLAAYTGSGVGADISNDVVLSRVTLRDIREAALPEYSATCTATGSDATDPLPLMTSLVVTLRTAKAGRRYRGRVYLPGWSEAANDATGRPIQSVADAAEAFITDLGTVVQGAGNWNLAVCSLANNASLAVTTVEVRDLIWDTQRRRNYPGI